MGIVLSQELQAVEFASPRFRLVEDVFEETVRHVLLKVSVELGEQGRLVQQITQVLASVCKLKIEIAVATLIVNVVGVVIKYVAKQEGV